MVTGSTATIFFGEARFSEADPAEEKRDRICRASRAGASALPSKEKTQGLQSLGLAGLGGEGETGTPPLGWRAAFGGRRNTIGGRFIG